MQVARGYRDPKASPSKEMNIHAHPKISGKILPPVTRVMPDCGHTYTIPSHIEPTSPLIQALCPKCRRNPQDT